MGNHAAFELKIAIRSFLNLEEVMTGNYVGLGRNIEQLDGAAGLEVDLLLHDNGFIQQPSGIPVKLCDRDAGVSIRRLNLLEEHLLRYFSVRCGGLKCLGNR
jgi:hypothetical protein